MAVNFIPGISRMQMRVQVGVNDEGKPMFKTRSYNNLKPGTSDEDFHGVATGIGSLQKFPVDSIKRVNEGELVSL